MSFSFRSASSTFRRHPIAKASLLFVATMMSASVSAQPSEPATDGTEADTNKGASQTTLAPVKAVAKTDSSTENSGSLTSGGVSIFRRNVPVRSIPQPVTVITRELMDERQFIDLHDVMRNTPGVTVNYTDSERITYLSRGYSIDTLQVDGLTINQGGSIFIQPDTAVLDRVEVLRGASGMLRGSGNPSAAVNMVRKRPTREFQSSAGFTVGSWDRYRVEADVSTPINEDGSFRGRVVAAYDKRDFFQKVREEEKQVVYGVVQIDAAPRTVVTASLQHIAVNATGAWGNMPADFNGAPLNMPRDTYLGADWNQWNRYNQQAFFEVEHDFDNQWNMRASAEFTRMRMRDQGFKQSYFTRSDGVNPIGGILFPAPTSPYEMVVTQSVYSGDANDQRIGNLHFSGPFQAFGRKHEAAFGADAQRVKIRPTTGNGSMNPVLVGDIRNWDPSGYPAPNYVAPENGVVYEIEQEGIYGTTRLSITDPLSVILGARVSWYEYRIPTNPSSRSNYSVAPEYTPYVGIVYDLSKNWSVYASYTDIFLPQNAYAVDGSILPPIRGEDYEVGLKGEFFDGLLNAQFSLFRIDNVNKAVDDMTGPSPCAPFYPAPNGRCKVAGGESRSQGFELELTGQLHPGWQVFASYTNTYTKYLADSPANTGNALRTNDPRHTARLFTTYRLGSAHRWTLGGGTEVQSSSYSTNGALTYRQGGYAVWNAMAAYDIDKKYSVQLNVDNLFDRYYYKQYSVTGISTYYGDPRNIMLSMRARF